ncbi:MarR family winged helix-turn-helix transcriptional regulator [Cryptosporangium phraense]|uniref:MarR family winged helix-turn-helix transcriptional regulator n=1 Tax=Cryptosporangium phraense TaxID=2593070 RepID=UPI00197A7C6A|nr:MarR family winged helix-turn-helix transcriptional regulator [Cryptosporangium phraense]
MTDLPHVFSDLVRAETRLYNGVDARLRNEHGLAASQYLFLRAINDMDKCRVNDLARAIAITVGAVSKGVDRLEAAGWVSRRPNPENRRSSLLEVTPAGRVKLEAATVTFQDALEKWLDNPAIEQLAASLAVLRGELEAADVGRPIG